VANYAAVPLADVLATFLAHERTTRHSLRTGLFVPLGRAATLWFTPRIDLLPFPGHLRPVKRQWREDPVDFRVTALLGALNFFYVGLALAGLLRASSRRGVARIRLRTGLALLVVFILVRTAFLTQVETPEPRYVLECFPALLVLGALVWLPRSSGATLPRQKAPGES
jgi:hypothetical protein